MKYKLKIKTVNKTFIVKGTPVRTPVIIENLSEKELNMYLSKIRFEGIRDNDYTIEEMISSSKPKTSNNKRKPKLDNELENIIDDENQSTLDKFLNDSDE